MLKGSNQTTLISSGLDTPEGMALDWVARKLYWTNDISPSDTIEVSELDGSNRMVLMYGGMDTPNDIVVHPMAG